MKARKPKHEHYLSKHRNPDDITKLAERLTPLEEIDASAEDNPTSNNNAKALVVDSGPLTLPQGFVESEPKERGVFSLEPVTLVILVLMLAFIAFITYLVYQTPTPIR